MGLFSKTKKFDSLECLFIDQLRDLYDAEQRITKALPKMIEAAHSPGLKSAFEHHLKETAVQVNRLEEIFKSLGKEAKAETCEAMQGLLTEGDEVIAATGDPVVRDAALIAAAQRVEHYEMAGYGCARTFAERLGHKDAAALLQKTLDEEGAADKKLTAIAEQSINMEASRK